MESIIGDGRGKQLSGEENTGNAAIRFGLYLFQFLLMKLDFSVLGRYAQILQVLSYKT